jgi:amino acid permease
MLRALPRRKFTTTHPSKWAPASLRQTDQTRRRVNMAKTFNITLAFLLFAPIAVAVALQAAKIVA